MADQDRDKPPSPPARESQLPPAMLAVALAVVAQLAVLDGLTLLGVAGYIVAAWLFLASVRGSFDGAPGQAAASRDPAATESETTGIGPSPNVNGGDRWSYLRHSWRLVTIAEIFRGELPPARLQGLEAETPFHAEPDDKPHAEDARTPAGLATSSARAARVESWTATDSAESAPNSVKVTPQGDVLVLDAGLEQVQRFDQAGNLLATYSLEGLATLDVLDMAVSADGRTLYIVDAASKRLQVITLTDDDSAGEEE